MIIENQINKTKAVQLKELGVGELFSTEYPPENIYIRIDSGYDTNVFSLTDNEIRISSK